MPDSLKEYNRKRDFSRTAEPSGGVPRKRRSRKLVFVIQKHAASQLHFDLRLEMEGVMRSWAVPKGPSLDPRVRRLAMEVEDHPMAYNDFEGTIPKGEYGGGTVMLWDRGTYEPDEVEKGEKAEAAVLRGYHAGKLAITFHGERLHGSFALVRTDAVQGGARSKWLMLKHKDEHADRVSDITEEVDTSVTTGRTLDQIARGEGSQRVWHSNRNGKGAPGESHGKKAAPAHRAQKEGPSRPIDLKAFLPMLARSAQDPPKSGSWVFEPKYDGIRILALVTSGRVVLATRNGLDKARQFPEIVDALMELVRETGEPFVVDGEVVALEGESIARFESLQGRMHLQSPSAAMRHGEESPAALIAFDLLLVGSDALVTLSWSDRRARLEDLLDERTNDRLRISETSPDYQQLKKRAETEGWEGVMAKRTSSPYQPGQRSSHWVKLKIENRQEFVVGGWTEPRKTRPHFGALLLGYYDDEGRLVHAGQTGTGFDGQTLADLHKRLKAIERPTPAFAEKPATNEPAHWVEPKLVVEVRFNEWTRGGKLRHPVYVGQRDDRDPKEIVREPAARKDVAMKTDPAEITAEEKEAASSERKPLKGGTGKKRGKAATAEGSTPTGAKRTRSRPPEGATRTSKSSGKPEVPAGTDALDTAVVRRILEIGAKRGEGSLRIGRAGSIPVTSLQKVFFPETGHTKQDVLVFYARMAPFILPWMEDRPLVLKRFPNGVDGESFYQQTAPDSAPEGVRVETLKIEGKRQRRLIGGNLATLLYTIQLGAISFDPWHTRVGDLDAADYTVLDLDPGEGVDFQGVVEVARHVKDELDELGLHGALKTSGSSGIHVYLPLPPGTPLEAATLVAQIVATRVARKHPKVATVERMRTNRPHGTVYVDYLQNILGKTVAGVYAVRAKIGPTVSTPLAWDELTDDLDMRAFTVDTVPTRVARLGDLWKEPMTTPNSLEGLMKGAKKRK